MAINLINPNYNLISTAQAAGAIRDSGLTETSNAASDGVQNFSDVLESAITKLQSPAASDSPAADAKSVTVNLDEIFRKASETYDVPIQLLKAVAKAESNFNPRAESHAGAQGVMQLMPGTARSLGVTDSFDPEQNIMGGAKYLSQQLARYDGNTVLALAAYNAGPGNVAKYDGVPPFKETRNYITKVMGYAGESITAGNAALSNQMNVGDAMASQIAAGETTLTDGISAFNTGSILQDIGLGLLNKDPDEMDIKDYELLMNMYRYKMQLSILSGSEPDSQTDDLFSSLTGLV